MLTRLNRIKSSLLINKFSPNQRQISNLRNIEIPKEVSQEFFRRTNSFYNIGRHIEFKPFSEKEAYHANQELRDVILKLDPRLMDQLQEAKEENPAVTLIKGISLPEIRQSDIPKEKIDLNLQSFQRLIRPAEAAIAAFSIALGVLPDDHIQDKVTGCVFATDSQKDNPNSFHSGKTMGFHNDGWDSGKAMPYIVLMGLFGHKSARTQVLPFSDIIQYLKENVKKEYWQALDSDAFLDVGGEYSIPEQTRILDTSKGEINFSEHGYRAYSPSGFADERSFYKGMNLLRESFANIPPIDLNIQRGELAKINNAQSLHRKYMESPENLVGARLLLRFLGSAEGSHAFQNLVKFFKAISEKENSEPAKIKQGEMAAKVEKKDEEMKAAESPDKRSDKKSSSSLIHKETTKLMGGHKIVEGVKPGGGHATSL